MFKTKLLLTLCIRNTCRNLFAFSNCFCYSVVDCRIAIVAFRPFALIVLLLPLYQFVLFGFIHYFFLLFVLHPLNLFKCYCLSFSIFLVLFLLILVSNHWIVLEISFWLVCFHRLFPFSYLLVCLLILLIRFLYLFVNLNVLLLDFLFEDMLFLLFKHHDFYGPNLIIMIIMIIW